jgi:hypothetical protein
MSRKETVAVVRGVRGSSCRMKPELTGAAVMVDADFAVRLGDGFCGMSTGAVYDVLGRGAMI